MIKFFAIGFIFGFVLGFVILYILASNYEDEKLNDHDESSSEN